MNKDSKIDDELLSIFGDLTPDQARRLLALIHKRDPQIFGRLIQNAYLGIFNSSHPRPRPPKWATLLLQHRPGGTLMYGAVDKHGQLLGGTLSDDVQDAVILDPTEWDLSIPTELEQATDVADGMEQDQERAHSPVEVFTDGACSGNPGPGGWGVVFRSAEREWEMSGHEPMSTNNRMELMAAISALEALDEGRRATIYTDSNYVKDGITSWIDRWQRNGWKTGAKKSVKNRDLWERLHAARERHQVSWEWIRGHAGHPENERADELARDAIREALQQATSPSPMRPRQEVVVPLRRCCDSFPERLFSRDGHVLD